MLATAFPGHAAGNTTTAPPKADPVSYPELNGLSKIYVVSPEGNDWDSGTPDRPFRTISQAAMILLPGEGVLVRAGTYRERVSPERGGEPGKPIVYFAEPGHRVVIKGSDVWKPNWKRVQDGIYSAHPDPGQFTDDAYWDSPNPLQVTVSATPWERDGRAEYEYFSHADDSSRDQLGQSGIEKRLKQCDTNLVFTLGQVFVDGRMFRQMPYRSEMESTPESWFYDSQAGRVFVHFAGHHGPDQSTIELTTRRRIFAPHRQGLAYIHVIGFVMEHCGNQYPKDFWAVPQNGQAGALGTRSGSHWVIRDNVIRFANGFGLDIGAEGKGNERGDDADRPLQPVGRHWIQNNLIEDNGAGGICGYHPNDVRIIGNVIERNNSLRFKGTKRWESAGIKLHRPDGGFIANNLFLDNYTHGFWADQGIGEGLRFTCNVIVGNNESENGVFIEMGEYGPDTGLVDNNIIIGNRNGFYCHDGSGATVSHNLIANSREYGVEVLQVTPRCNTRNHSFFDNLLIGNTSAINLNYPAELGGNIRLGGNVYGAREEDRVFVINRYSKFNPPWKDSEFGEMVRSKLKAAEGKREFTVTNGLVKLSFVEWKAFWSRIASADESSLAPAARLSVDAKALKVTLSLSPPMAGHTGKRTSVLKFDFLGNPIPQDGTALAGPFQKLQDGQVEINLREALQAGEELNSRLARKTGASENDNAESAKHIQSTARTVRGPK